MIVKINIVRALFKLPCRSTFSKAAFAALALVLLGVGSACAQSYGDPVVISGIWGSNIVDNTSIVPDPGSPSIAGSPPNAPVWFQWTAPQDGDVQLDTFGSVNGTGAKLDTILGVFTSNSTNLVTVNQVAANDDMYPFGQYNQSGQDIYNASQSIFASISATFFQPYSGPSGLHFNAKAGKTYYFVVDSKGGANGSITLNWAYHSSGIFRFASENLDQTGFYDVHSNAMLLYVAAATESEMPSGPDMDSQTIVHTYYTNNAPGLLVTITRVAGSSGRALVQYTTRDPDPALVVGGVLPNGDIPAVAGLDYTPVSGTLAFDDFEMSKTILIPILNQTDTSGLPNRDFFIAITNVLNDPFESSEVSPARLDPAYFQAVCRILSVDIDPKGPGTSTNGIAVFNFQKANYRVPRDVQSGYWGSTPVTIYVNRTGTNSDSASIRYSVNNYFQNPSTDTEEQNNVFPLQPGSDYATPTPADAGDILGTNSDFQTIGGESGTLSWAADDFDPKPIQFNIPNNLLPGFNKDIRVQLFDIVSQTNIVQVGMVAETTITILFDDQSPPAGSVDENFNADMGLDMKPPVATVPPQIVYPGTDGEVYGLVIQTNDQTIIVGRFYSYDLTSRNCIARINSDGSLDMTFNPAGGVDAFNSSIQAIALTSSNQVIIGGDFLSYNGTQRNSIARLNSNGSLDGTFNPGIGANGPVYTVIARSDGKVLIGGDFTSFNGTPRKYLARLNSNGSLDTTFNPGNNFNAPVYSIAAEGDTHFSFDRTATGTELEDVNIINVGAASGTLTLDYDFMSGADDLRVFYGNTNGVLIFDTGLITNTGSMTLPFGPTGGKTNNVITVVMNQGNTQTGTTWSYTGMLDVVASDQITAVGDFTTVGGIAGQDHIARILGDGSVDVTFDPGLGVNGTVYSVSRQEDGDIVIGGEFTQVNGVSMNRLARLTSRGAVDANFFSGTGANNTVYHVNCQSDGTIYIGGVFTAVNGTHRLGFARLNSDGTVDTTFLDTAYNQFAGLPRVYHGDTPGAVFTSGIQSDGNVMIGGSFNQVGGGQFSVNVRPEDFAFDDTTSAYLNQDVWPEPKTRDGIRNRNNIARLIGGSTPGPGNISLFYESYSVNKSQESLFVSLVRTNGNLGPASANFSILPGLAQSGLDYLYNSAAPYYGIAWVFYGPTRAHSDGLFGLNSFVEDIYGNSYNYLQSRVILTSLNNPLASGDQNAQFQLANPSGADNFYLGGQNIPLGLALGRSSAPLTIIDDHHVSGTFGFSSPDYTASSNAVINVNRTGGAYGVVQLNYRTTTNGSTAIAGTDYTAINNGVLNFANGQTNRTFNVAVLRTNYVSSVEKIVNLQLYNLQPPINGDASLGLSNAVLRIINPNFQGFLTLSTNNYAAKLSAGFITATVKRTVGSKGTLTIQYATTNDTAVSGVDFVGATNTLQWNSGDVSPKTISFPLINNGDISGPKQFNVVLFNPQTNGVAAPELMGVYTDATMVISNDNSYGTFQFSAAGYVVDENGGYATITVKRSGSVLGSATVDFATANGTAFDGANYHATNGMLSFAPGQSATNFTVRVVDDGVMNPPPDSFFFNVSLSNPSMGAKLGGLIFVPVKIVDAESFNHPSGTPDVSFNTGSGMNDDVLALALQSNGKIIAGGNFTSVNGVNESHLARLNADGTLDADNFLNGLSGANGSVRAVASQTDDRVLIGGGFTLVNGIVRNYIARLNTDGSVDTSFNPGSGANNTVLSLAEAFVGVTRVIYVGGSFTTFNGSSSHGVARLNDHGTIDGSFNVGIGANDAVYAVAAYPTNSIFAGKVLVGGNFNNFNGVSVNYILRLNVDGSVDTNFVLNAGLNDVVRAIAIQSDDSVVVGGDFIAANDTEVGHIARLEPDGSLDTNFITNIGTGMDDVVNAIALQADGRIVAVGDFTRANGITRSRIARLMPDGSVDNAINFGSGANGPIDAVVVQPNDQMLVIGGAFTEFHHQANNHIARLYGGSVAGSGEFRFSSAGYQVAEDGFSTVIEVQRTGGTAGPNEDGSGNVSVDFSTSDDTAVSGVNYSGTNITLTFPPGEVSRTVIIPVMDDSVVTSDLTVDLTLSNPTAPSGLGDQPTSVLTILNTDSAVHFFSAGYSVAKNDLTGAAAIDLVRDGSTNGICSVIFTTTTNGTAIVGTDYTPTNTIITFNPGETLKTVNVPIINNAIPEGVQTVTMQLSDAVGTLLSNPTNAVLSIIDTINSPGQLTFGTNINYVAGEGDGSAYLTVSRINGSSGSVSVHYTTVDGTALAETNYTSTSSTVTFNEGVVSREIAIPLVDNNLAQGAVTFTVALSSPSGGATLADPTNAAVTVFDNDVGVAFLNATNFANEIDSNASVFVRRIGDTSGAFSVDFATADGSAVAGTNYVATSGPLTFSSGEVQKAILIPLINSPTVTGDQMFTISLSNASPPALITAPSVTSVVLHDANAGLSFTNDSLTVFKDAGNAVITVICSNPEVEPVVLDSNSVPLSVDYYTTNGTGTAGVDYVAVSGTLVFTNGIGTNTFSVPLINNTALSGDRTFIVRLANPVAPGYLVSPSNMVVTIVDGQPRFRYSRAYYSVSKSGVSAAITVLRTGYTNNTASVDFLATNGTAMAGQNFVSTNGTLTFTNGQTSRSFNVGIIDDNVPLPNKTVQLSLSNPVNGALGAPAASSLTIFDISGSLVVPSGATLLSESGPVNGLIDPGETVSMMFAFRVAGGTNVPNLNAVLLATNGISSPSPAGQQSYGALTAYGPSVSRPFTFTASAMASQKIAATFSLKDGLKDLGQTSFSFSLGMQTNVYASTSAIIIRDLATAQPYPSIINVTNAGSVLVKAAVTLTNLTHGSIHDVNALLVAPNMSDVMFMSHVGTPAVGASHITLKFDDDAATSLPASGAIGSGTNKPTAYPTSPVFP